VEHSQDGIFITQDGRIMFCNRGFREILGYAEGELDNAAIEKVIAPEDREMVVSRHYARLSGNRLPEVYECLFLAKNGSTRRVRMDVGLATYQGKPATIGTIRDVTEERQREEELKRSEEKYRSLVENLQDVAYRADREGRLVMISPSGVALLGYDSQDDLLGKPLAETFYYDKSRRQEFLERIEKEGTVKNVEIELRHKNGSPITVSTSSHLYYDSAKNVLGVEGVLHDITDLKKKEVELKKTYEQIAAAEEELRGQYGELEQSAAQLRESEARLRYLLEFYKNEQKREYELFMAAVEGAGFITSSPLGYLAFVSKDESEISMFAWSKKAQKACAMPDKAPDLPDNRDRALGRTGPAAPGRDNKRLRCPGPGKKRPARRPPGYRPAHGRSPYRRRAHGPYRWCRKQTVRLYRKGRTGTPPAHPGPLAGHKKETCRGGAQAGTALFRCGNRQLSRACSTSTMKT